MLDRLFQVEDGMVERAQANRAQAKPVVLDLFRGQGPAGDSNGKRAWDRVVRSQCGGGYSDWHRRYTRRTNQVQRSFEDAALKQRGFDLVLADVR